MREGDRACTAAHAELEGCRSVRRFGWLQIGGLGVALAAVVVLGMLAFGCGSSSPTHPVTPHASVSAHASATADPRVAEVEAAARRYIEAVEQSAKTGDASEVDKLVVPGSQAEGNAGIASSFSQSNHYNFISTRIDYDSSSWQTDVAASTATVDVKYALFGHNADWPSLTPREPDHEIQPVSLHLVFELRGGQWLLSQSSS